MSKNKICFVCPWMHNDGGLQRVVSNLANMLAEANDVTLCIVSISNRQPYYKLNPKISVVHLQEAAIRDNYIFKRLLRKVFNLLEVPLTFLSKLIYYPLKRVEALENFLITNEYDYVIASCGDLSMLLACTNRDKFHSKLIGWQHNSFSAYFEKRGKYYYGRKLLAKKLYRKLDKVICLTEKDSYAYSRNFNINSNYIYNPLSFKSQEKTDINQKSLIFVGRLDWEQKGLEYLTNIIEKFFCDSRSNDWNIIVVGDGNGKDRLKNRLINSDFYNKIHFVGQTNNVQNYFLQSSICLNTSKWEGFGLVLTEAMECGLPVVAFSTDGPSEIITDGVDGYIVPNYDIDYFSEKVLEIANSADLRKRMSESAIKKAYYFSQSAILKEWKEMLNKLEE